jgi:hypothetical protein
MAQPHELRSYQYVNRPFNVVRDGLKQDPSGVFQRATTGAAGRADALAANLRVELGGLEVGTDITIKVVGFEEFENPPRLRVKIAWQAAKAAAIFPSMEAELSVYPLSKEETQLDLHGLYRPPLGAIGNAVDSLVGHRIAEASVHRFVSDVAALLRAELPEG